MRFVPRWLLITALGVVVLALALTSAVTVMLRAPFPQTDGEIPIAAIGAPVTVTRDHFGVPHLHADTSEDLFTAQGFVTAQDRFFQMDLQRHVASGRAAELLGEALIDSDIQVRTMGWYAVAQAEINLLSAEARRLLEAYAAGVNEYRASRSVDSLAIEYAILGLSGGDYQPEVWTVADSLVWLKAMGWSLEGDLDVEVERVVRDAELSPEQAELLHSDSDLAPILQGGDVVGDAFVPEGAASNDRPAAGLPTAAVQALASLSQLRENGPSGPGKPADLGLGSNSFVVSGDRTATGLPILSNDPHLSTSIPSPMMQIGLHCRVVDQSCPYDVAGFTFAGLAGVVFGHNGHISWGVTAPYIDTQDLVVERIVDGQVVTTDGPVDLTLTEEVLQVRNGEPRTLQVRTGPHGPLLSDIDPRLADASDLAPPDSEDADEQASADPAAPEYAVALQWTGLQPSRSAETILRINRAASFDEFREASSLLATPALSLVYADSEGDIGYQLAASVPNRRGSGALPTAGWTSQAGWEGSVPFAELPYVHNPPEGFVVAANQTIIEDYPVRLQSLSLPGWRSAEIARRLSEHEQLDLDQAQDIFVDDTSRLAATMVPLLNQVDVDDPWVEEGRALLRDWDGAMAVDSAAAAYFTLTVRAVMERTFAAHLPPQFAPTGGERWMAALETMLHDPDSSWWDDPSTPQVEGRDEVLAEALREAKGQATVLMSTRIDSWSWGRLHRLIVPHQVFDPTGVPLLQAVFNHGDAPIGGGPSVVNAWAYSDHRSGFDVTSGPAMRMIVDHSDLDASRWINLTGASGHATHPHYSDQYQLMVDNGLQPFPFSQRAIEAAAEDRLVLVPR